MTYEIATLLGVTFTAYSGYAMWNSIDNQKNKICNFTELKSLTGEGISLSRNVRLSIKQSNNHTLMVAPCESGWETILT